MLSPFHNIIIYINTHRIHHKWLLSFTKQILPTFVNKDVQNSSSRWVTAEDLVRNPIKKKFGWNVASCSFRWFLKLYGACSWLWAEFARFNYIFGHSLPGLAIVLQAKSYVLFTLLQMSQHGRSAALFSRTTYGHTSKSSRRTWQSSSRQNVWTASATHRPWSVLPSASSSRRSPSRVVWRGGRDCCLNCVSISTRTTTMCARWVILVCLFLSLRLLWLTLLRTSSLVTLSVYGMGKMLHGSMCMSIDCIYSSLKLCCYRPCKILPCVNTRQQNKLVTISSSTAVFSTRHKHG